MLLITLLRKCLVFRHRMYYILESFFTIKIMSFFNNQEDHLDYTRKQRISGVLLVKYKHYQLFTVVESYYLTKILVCNMFNNIFYIYNYTFLVFLSFTLWFDVFL